MAVMIRSIAVLLHKTISILQAQDLYINSATLLVMAM